MSNPEPETSKEPEPEPAFVEPTGEYFNASVDPEAENIVPEPTELVNSFAEPVPDWPIAKSMWNAGWEIHIYGVATLFAVLAILALINIIRLSRKQKLQSRGYFISLNAIMLVFGILRAVFFFVDGYNSNGIFPQALAYFFISIAFPSLTAAFYILFTALIKSLRVKYMSPRIFSLQALIAIIAFNYVFSLTVDFIVGYFFEAKLLILFCQITYALWGILFTLSFIVLFIRLYNATNRKNKEITRMGSQSKKNSRDSISAISSHHVTTFTSQNTLVPKLRKMSLSVKISLVTCIFFMLLTILNVFGMVSDMGIMTTRTPDPWPWWVYNFLFRLCELGMSYTIVYVGYLPFRQHDAHDHSVHSNSESQYEEKYRKFSEL